PFNEIIDRTGYNAFKLEFCDKVFGTTDVIPMWVADMDFKAPQPVLDAFKERIDHGIIGYNFKPAHYYESIQLWMKQQHGWDIETDWLSFSPGSVAALNLSILAFTHPGDNVLIQTPVYYPFYDCVTDHSRELLTNPLHLRDGKYEIDFDHFEEQLRKGVKVFILCNPHNPVSRVFTKEELTQMADLCLKYNVLILSDEVHADLVHGDHRHIPIASLSDDISNITLTLNSHSKTFNLAGTATAYVISENEEIRKKYFDALHGIHIHLGNTFGDIALESAYTHGAPWLGELLNYLEENINFLDWFLKEHIPQIKLIKPEATYLMWLDCRDLFMSQKELNDFFIKNARVGLSNGAQFGKEGTGFMRMNIACPQSLLSEALERIQYAITDLPKS
ncbi:MAG: PatB family C-S lyase, partial [Fibrobacterales bacterium]